MTLGQHLGHVDQAFTLHLSTVRHTEGRVGEGLCDKSGMMNSIELIGGNYMAAKGGSLQ